jgi:hypothetical protein
LEGGMSFGVIVTVVTGANKQDWVDFELPSDLPISEVILMLADAITNEEHSMDEGHYILEVKSQTGDWRKLDETKSLDDYKIMDGAYLRFRKQLEGETQIILKNQLEQLAKEKIKGSLEAWRTDY